MSKSESLNMHFLETRTKKPDYNTGTVQVESDLHPKLSQTYTPINKHTGSVTFDIFLKHVCEKSLRAPFFLFSVKWDKSLLTLLSKTQSCNTINVSTLNMILFVSQRGSSRLAYNHELENLKALQILVGLLKPTDLVLKFQSKHLELKHWSLFMAFYH